MMCMAGCYVCELVQEQIGQVLAKIWALKYDTRCYFNVRSKADISRLNLPHAETTTKHCKRVKLKVKTAYARGNRKSLRNYVVSAEEEKERLQWEGFAEKRRFQLGLTSASSDKYK